MESIILTDSDTFSLDGYNLVIHRNGSIHKKGTLTIGTNFQYRALLKALVVGWADDEPADWGSVDLSGLEE